MTQIKICGIRRKIDVEYVNQYMPEYIGYVFAKSKRQVSRSEVIELSKDLNTNIKKVGVFVNEELDSLLETALKCRLDVLQLHGEENPEYIDRLKEKLSITYSSENSKIEVWKAFRVKDKDSLKGMKDYKIDVFVLDTYIPDSYGGSGKIFDWDIAVGAKEYGKIAIAGGLSIENVNKAIKILNPWAVDVSSGVETEGFKNKGKIGDFICAVRNK